MTMLTGLFAVIAATAVLPLLLSQSHFASKVNCNNEPARNGCCFFLSGNDCSAKLYERNGNRCINHYAQQLTGQIKWHKIVGVDCAVKAFIVYLHDADNPPVDLTHCRCGSRFIERCIVVMLIFGAGTMHFLYKKMKRNLHLLRIWWFKRELERFRGFGVYR